MAKTKKRTAIAAKPPTKKAKNPIVRNSKGHFVTGQSANPGGMYNSTGKRDLTTVARNYTRSALMFLAQVLEGKVETYTTKDRIVAAKELLDRGWGRASATVDITHSIATDSDTLADTASRILKRRAELAKPVRIVVDKSIEEIRERVINDEENGDS